MTYVMWSEGSLSNVSALQKVATGRSGFDLRRGQRVLPLASVQTGSGAHPASCTMGTGVLSPGVNVRPGRDADHSPPSSAEVENE
jgi:hypothetical protein